MSRIAALVVRQWLRPEWDQAQFTPVPTRRKPNPHFYLFSINAYDLRRLSGIYRRDPTKPPAEDTGIQRRYFPERSKEILRYLLHGFPLSRIDPKKLVDPGEIDSLRMPGWLPTAIVVNILTAADGRGPKGTTVSPGHLVKVHYSEGESVADIELPAGFDKNDWQPAVHPIEVIDGQHRLWALQESPEEPPWSGELKEKIANLQIPVVAFHGLDTTWQAYLFYTINQLPKKIDTSLVFDLYPLLRTEEWLLRFEGPNIYRETRSQDLTILLWSHPESPWRDRILRHGGRERGKITQAAFIRTLMASFVKRWYGGPRSRIGGLFGTPRGTHRTQLNWTREQQAAFLIVAWHQIRDAVTASNAPWAVHLMNRCMGRTRESGAGRRSASEAACRQELFSGPDSLLATDQGVRGYLLVLNDLLWVAYDRGDILLDRWNWTRKTTDDAVAISDAMADLAKELPEVVAFIAETAGAMASFDWRLFSAVANTDSQYYRQASYRGSSGYREIRRNLLVHLRDALPDRISSYASDVLEALHYETDEES